MNCILGNVSAARTGVLFLPTKLARGIGVVGRVREGDREARLETPHVVTYGRERAWRWDWIVGRVRGWGKGRNSIPSNISAARTGMLSLPRSWRGGLESLVASWSAKHKALFPHSVCRAK
ncbi:hypothetical protein [Pedosphaera parvula]|uniref:Uncharacterized protein n=1 Tax=Pedosphaera parvula (strain Ellin514) TaxID=320771 RepID=B9XQG9_PEDPL|nr:hypothetical protein [Pedosphaera parvula]EEF57894.1 hypothetical protein Cflav_PD0844 [Pedosphaera parvula Ellin514]